MLTTTTKPTNHQDPKSILFGLASRIVDTSNGSTILYDDDGNKSGFMLFDVCFKVNKIDSFDSDPEKIINDFSVESDAPIKFKRVISDLIQHNKDFPFAAKGFMFYRRIDLDKMNNGVFSVMVYSDRANHLFIESSLSCEELPFLADTRLFGIYIKQICDDTLKIKKEFEAAYPNLILSYNGTKFNFDKVFIPKHQCENFAKELDQMAKQN